MIDFWRVLTALREYYSPEGEDRELLPLCKSAALELQVRLRKGADAGDIRLINAAAAIANYRLCMKKITSSDGTESFKAGDVTVSISHSAMGEYAEKERSRALLDALPLLRDDEFVFKQVSI